jgi:hypothetical protein
LKNLFPARVICPWTMAGKWQSFNDLKYASFVDAGTTLPQAGGSASHSFSRPGSPTYIWDEDQDRFLTLPTVFEITNKGGALLNPPLFLRLSAFHDAWAQFMCRLSGGLVGLRHWRAVWMPSIWRFTAPYASGGNALRICSLSGFLLPGKSQGSVKNVIFV